MKIKKAQITYAKDGKKRYRLGHIDLYSAAVQKTVLENSSVYQTFFNINIEENKLRKSLIIALKEFPLFSCELIYDKEYYLQEINNDVRNAIKHCEFSDRPKIFGNKHTTNKYLFQVCYFDNWISFEWCHAVTDGAGAMAFFSCILNAYFDGDPNDTKNTFNTELAYESVYNKDEKGFGQNLSENGYKSGTIKMINNGYKCTANIVRMPTNDILKVSKKSDATPVAIIVPLFCKAIRKQIPFEVENRDVSCCIIYNARLVIKCNTFHNCVFTKTFSYNDLYDKQNIYTQGSILRTILDVFGNKENISLAATKMMDEADALYRLRPRFLSKLILKIIAKPVKNRLGNFTISYLGKINFTNVVQEHIVDFIFTSWPDTSECVIAMVDLNDELILNITENYRSCCLIKDFVDICKENNIKATITDKYEFEQANVRT